jgi:hypothetical protein
MIQTAGPQAPSTDTLLAAMTEAKGHPKIALARLQEQGYSNLTMASLVDELKDHLPELKQRMEVVAELELFSLMPLLSKTLVENLSALEPKDAVGAYMHLMELITKNVGTTDINLNVNDTRFAQLPRNVQQALALVEATGTTVIDHEPEGAA